MPRSIACLILVLLVTTASQAAEPDSFQPNFYAFQNGLGFEDEPQTLKDLGYAGVSQVSATGDKLADLIAAYDQAGLKVLSVYLHASEVPIAAEQVRPLANRGAMIELTVRKVTPQTIHSIRQTAEMAAGLKIRVALYPHDGMEVETIPQALDVIRQVDHPNLGVMFNLCHFLKNESADDLEKVLAQAGPQLFAVSTAGADIEGKQWSELIQTLDQGDFPQARLLRQLKKQGFAGPVTLQCYGVQGDKKQNLERSINAWRKTIGGL